MLLDEFHPAFRTFSRLVLHYVGVHGARVLFGLAAALFLCRFTATAQADHSEQEDCKRRDCHRFAIYFHGFLCLLFGSNLLHLSRIMLSFDRNVLCCTQARYRRPCSGGIVRLTS